MQIDVVDELRQPEYTGENRCEPCTVLNLAIAAILGSIVARKSRLGGLLAVGVSIALISLRGYLVPGTPTLTKRYLPPEVLRWFGKDPEPAVASGLGGVDDGPTTEADRDLTADDAVTFEEDAAVATDDAVTFEEDAAVATDDAATATAGDGTAAPGVDDDAGVADLETFFLANDVLEPCEDRDDLCLTDEFEAVWFDEIDPLAASGIDVEAAVDAFGFDADPEAFELSEHGEAYRLLSETGAAGRWPSHAALLADVAASRALASWTDDWDAYAPETKGEILNGLRMFLETCPGGGDVRMGEEVVESCCSSHEVIAVTCEDTGERLFEQRLADVDA